MNKLKKILLTEATPFIPFSLFSNKITKYWNIEGDSKVHGSTGEGRRFATNAFVSILGGIGIIVYLGLSANAHSLSTKKWGEFYEQRAKQITIEQEADQRDYLMQQFNKADTNKDYVLDSIEFYNSFKHSE